MLNLFKRNATIGVINTPECGTHNITSIRTHNSQRTEHKYIGLLSWLVLASTSQRSRSLRCKRSRSTEELLNNFPQTGYVEHQFFNQYNGPKPELYGRYIDDCIGAISSSREELDQFITSVDSFHGAPKYTWEISETSLAFLYIKVSISGNVLCISVHYKPTDSHSYLLYSSSHPSHVKISLSLLSQLSRGHFAANRFERERLLRKQEWKVLFSLKPP